MEAKKSGAREGWKDGRMEGWKEGRREGGEEGRREGLVLGTCVLSLLMCTGSYRKLRRNVRCGVLSHGQQRTAHTAKQSVGTLASPTPFASKVEISGSAVKCLCTLTVYTRGLHMTVTLHVHTASFH